MWVGVRWADKAADADSVDPLVLRSEDKASHGISEWGEAATETDGVDTPCEWENSVGRGNKRPMCVGWYPRSSACRCYVICMCKTIRRLPQKEELCAYDAQD